MEGGNPIVHVRDVFRTFDVDTAPVRALRGADLDVANGEFVAITGPSGCGKSTLLSIVAGLEVPDDGVVEVAGHVLSTLGPDERAIVRRSAVGVIFQFFNLLESMTAAENIAVRSDARRGDRRAAGRRARELLDLLGLADKVDAAPTRLSGGQRQRLAIARAMANAAGGAAGRRADGRPRHRRRRRRAAALPAPQRRRPDDRDGHPRPRHRRRRVTHGADARRADGAPVTAWWAWVAHDARRRWRGALVLAVLLAVGGGVVLSAFVGARRNATVVQRLQERTLPMTAMALPNQPGFDWEPVRELPYVRSMQLFAVSGFDVTGHPDANADFPRASLPSGEPMELEIVDAGRLPEATATDEVAISAAFHRRTGLDVGDELTLEVPGPGVLEAMILGQPMPAVASTPVTVTIVGIAQGSFWRGDVQTPYGFWQAHQDTLTPPGTGYVNAMLLVDGGAATIPRVEADLERIAGRPIEVIDWTRQLAQITTATKVESSALLAFALVATLVTFVLGAIAIVRSVAASGAEVETLRAIGFTRRQTTTAAAARPTMAVVVGIGGAAVIAWLLSGRYPIGVGRQGEPSPGRHANLALLSAGVAVLVLVGIATALLAAWRIGRPRVIGGAPFRSRVGARSGRATCRCR